MRYEVIEQYKGIERVIATVRRENGAIAERDIAIASAYANARKHAEAEGRAVQGPNGKDPNAVAVIYFGEGFIQTHTYTYRRVGGEPDLSPDLTDVLLASCLALSGATL